MGETDLHRNLMIDLIEALKYHYRARPEVYVSGNILFYYEQGNPRAQLSPDVLVTPGIGSHPREIYKLWEEASAPALVIEVTSKSTKLRDIGIKKGLYEAIGVGEYLLFDPRSEYLHPRFQVFRNENGLFVPCLAPETTGYQSDLGLIFRVAEGVLRIFPLGSETPLPTPRDLAALAEKNAQRADSEAARAESEAARAESEAARAEEEKARADKLAERLRELGQEP